MNKAAWIIGFVSFLLSSIPAVAQVSSDNSTGTIVAPNGNVFEITGGTAVGGRNLFHSFDQFDIPIGGEASFLNDPGIVNVFSRVTGGKASEIDGVLRSNGTANFFLMNPSGIVFKENASLDVGGSFVATTANGIQFGDRGSFTASVSPVSDILEIDPSAFLFSQLTGSIQNRSIVPGGLRVLDGSDLVLLGGDVVVDNSNITAAGGRVEIGSVAGTGSVGLQLDGNTLKLGLLNQLPQGKVALNNSRIIVIAGGGGDVSIQARDIELTQGSIILAGIGPNLGGLNQQAGDINITATGKVSFTDGSIISNTILGGIGNSGSINIVGQQINLLNGSTIANVSLGLGSAGGIDLRADDSILIAGRDANQRESAVLSNIASFELIGLPGFAGTGNGGDINLQARSITLADRAIVATNTLLSPGNSGNIRVTAFDSLETKGGALFSTSTQGGGNAGNITIKAGDRISFAGIRSERERGGVSSAVEPVANVNTTRRGGDVSIETRTLKISDEAAINSSTSGRGNAGNVFVEAKDDITLDNSLVFSNVEAGGVGDGGSITIIAKSLTLQDGGQIQSLLREGNVDAESPAANGRAGNIKIQLSEGFKATGIDSSRPPSGIFASVGTETIGSGGNVEIFANSVSLSNDATITTETFSSGRGGNISITADRLSATDGGQISSSSGRQGTSGLFGSGGDISIKATDAIELDATTMMPRGNRAGIFAETASADRAGDITIETKDLTILNGAAISSSSSFGGSLGGDGGNITVNALGVIKLAGRESAGSQRRSVITTEGNLDVDALESFGLSADDPANAGDMKITTGQLLISGEAALSSSNFRLGRAGNIMIEAKDKVDLTNDSFIESLITSNARGSGGRISLSTASLSLSDRSQISAQNLGQGTAGDIEITSNNTINVSNSQISTTAEEREGGNIEITAKSGYLLLRQQSDIRTDLAEGQGSGGNITLSADAIVALENSDILAFAPDGKGGNITFNTRAFLSNPLYRQTPSTLGRNALDALLTNGQADVNASGAVSGTVAGIPNITFLQNGLTQLPQTAIDTNALLANSCIVRNEQNGTFFITGTGGLPTNPGDLSTYSTGTVQPVRSNWKQGDAIVEPQGVYQLPNGALVLSRECS